MAGKILNDRAVFNFFPTREEANQHAALIVAKEVRVISLHQAIQGSFNPAEAGFLVVASDYDCPCCGSQIESFK